MLKATGTVLEEANTAPKKQNVGFTDDDVALRQENARLSDENTAIKVSVGDYASFTWENVTPRRDNTEYCQEVVTLKTVSTETV